MGALRFDGVNDIVSLPLNMTGNAGTSAYTMRVKSGPAGITLPASGLAGLIGAAGVSTTNGLAVNSTGQLRIYTAGTNRYGSTAQLIFTGTAFDYTLTHNADGTWNIYNNITSSPTGESGTFSSSFAFSNLNQFGRSSNSNTVYLQGDIDTIEVTGLANSQSWQADLSGGTGSTLPTVSGANQGSLVNFPTNNSQWIGFSSAYSASVSSTFPQFSASVASSYALPSYSAQLDATFPQFSASVSASQDLPVYYSSADVAFPNFTASASASSTLPSGATISVSFPQFSAAAIASSDFPEYSAIIASSFPQFAVSVQAGAANNDRQVTVSATFPQFSVSLSAEYQALDSSAVVAATFPQFTASLRAGGIEYFVDSRAAIIKQFKLNSLEKAYLASAMTKPVKSNKLFKTI